MRKSTFFTFLVFTILLFAYVTGCGSSDSQTDGDSDFTEDDKNTDGDIESSESDTDTLDGDSDGDSDLDVEEISEEEETEIGDECTGDEEVCSEDGFYLRTCENGYWIDTNCWQVASGVCKNNECVANWKQHDVTFSACADDPHKDSHTLAEKAAHMDKVTPNLNIHPKHMLVSSPVELRVDYYEDWAVANSTTVAEMTDEDYLKAEEDATYEDVIKWNTGENDGLWSSMYVASQVFRYAVTKDQQALDNIKLSLGGTYRQLKITGTPGIYTREIKTPDIEGMSFPNECSYIPDIDWDGGSEGDKNDNRWIRIKDGCLQHYEAEWNGGDCLCDTCNGNWVTEETCGLDEFEGYSWLDNVSKDEYSGHMMAAAMAARLVDEEEINNIVNDIYSQVVDHLIRNSMTFIDHDGLECEHGDHWALSLRGTPGFNSALALSYFRAAINVTGKQEFIDYYSDCLLKENGPNDCIDQLTTDPNTSYIKHIEDSLLLYMGTNGCKSNWNNFSMAMISMFGLIWHENDPARRTRIQSALEEDLMEANSFRAIIKQNNTLYNYIYGAMRNNRDDFPVDAINGANCQMQQFPISLAQREVTNTLEERPENLECESRFPGKYLSDIPMQIYQRSARNFIWWSNPYGWDNSSADRFRIYPGSDYLLTYWMGRYFGFISETD